MRHAVGAVAAHRADVDRLDTGAFWQVLWRELFRCTLLPEHVPLVRDGNFLLTNLQPAMIVARAVLHRRPIMLDTRGYDFLMTQTLRPLRVSPGTRHIVRYHDMVPLLQPDSRPSLRDVRWHHTAIKNTPPSAFFLCNSDPTYENLTSVYPELRGRSATIPNTLSEYYWPQRDPDAIGSIIERRTLGGNQRRRAPTAYRRQCVPARQSDRSPLHHVRFDAGAAKNFDGLMGAFKALRTRASLRQKLGDLKLLIVGSPGWRCESILKEMRELTARGELFHLEQVSTEELRILYSHAEALVFPSHAEGFGYPPLEAMRCGTPVVASDIPEHRWVLGDAATYCHSYDVPSIAAAIERLVASDDSEALRAELVARGFQRVQRFSFDNCREQWLDLLHRLKQEGNAASDPAVVGLPQTGSLERVA